MELELLNWHRMNINKNFKATSGEFRRKAMELSKYDDFMASKTWFKKFKDRNKIEVIRGRKAINKCIKE